MGAKNDRNEVITDGNVGAKRYFGTRKKLMGQYQEVPNRSKSQSRNIDHIGSLKYKSDNQRIGISNELVRQSLITTV